MTAMGPTHVMRQEHRLIAATLEALHTKVQARDPNLKAEEQELLDLLAQHNRKEELVPYPDLDNMLDDEERKQIFAEMDRLPPERYRTCCGAHEQ